MLNQAPGDRQILAQKLNISPHQLSYVTQANEGEGLLFYGNVIVPFVDRFPKDTEMYRMMTTKFSDLQKGGKCSMTNTNIEIFNNAEFGSVRVLTLSGEPWFVGRDVASALGYANTKDALGKHVDQEDKRIIQRSSERDL